MSIVVTKRHSEEFPVGIQMNDGTIHVLTLSVALELRNYLTDAIEWAVNMDDIRREALARDRKLNTTGQALRSNSLDPIVGRPNQEE